MLQIPVEGGHRGADLTVRHGLETAQLDRSRDNGHLLYLSASFIDCAHEISPITEGCSVVLTYQLIRNMETLSAVPRGICFPTFFSALNTVQQILSPLNSPTEHCDSEVMVIPLSNDYARTPLSYTNLRGSDQLMACLLQSSNFLEVRLAMIVNYRAGTAYDERRMNTDRAVSDDGYPESPRQLELDQSQSNSKKRFVAEVMEEDCWIKEIFLLNGQVDTSENSVPIVWNRDYIFDNIESAEDLFDEVSPPDREKYDRYHTPADGLELKQWWYKPVLIAYPKDSVAIKCRNDFSAVVTNLSNKIPRPTIDTSQMEDQQSNLLEFKKVVNYLNREKLIEEYAHNHERDLKNLLEMCIALKAEKEGLDIFRYYSPCSEVYWLDFTPQMAAVIDIVGWSACIEFLTQIFSHHSHEDAFWILDFKVDLMGELLKGDSASRNEASVAVYQQLFVDLFNSEEMPANDNFVDRIIWLLNCYHGNVCFFVSIFLLERRHLLENAEHLIPLITVFIKNFGITPPHLRYFVDILLSSSLVSDYSILQMHEEVQQLLIDLCNHFLHRSELPLTTDLTSVCHWIKLVVFVGDGLMIQQLTDHICSYSSSLEMAAQMEFLKDILTAVKGLSTTAKFKMINQLKRTLCFQLRRRRRSVAQLRIDCSRLETPLHLLIGASTSVVDLCQLRQLRESQLNKFVDCCLKISLDDLKLSKQEVEEEFISFCELLNVCNKLLNNEKITVLLFNRFLASKCFGSDYLIRPELLAEIASSTNRFGFYPLFSSLPLYMEREKEWRATFQILLSYHLLKLRTMRNYTAAGIFNQTCSVIIFPSGATSESVVTQCISTIDQHYRHVFFFVVVLIEDLQMLRHEAIICEAVNKYLLQSSISEMNRFLQLLFEDSSPLAPLNQLKFRARKLLTDLCNYGITRIYLNPLENLLGTEDFLNWFRLSLYLGDSWRLELLLNYFCSRSTSTPTDSSLRQLLAHADFQTQPCYKSVREHYVLREWKKRMQRESFAKLFIRRSRAAIKRKLPATPSID